MLGESVAMVTKTGYSRGFVHVALRLSPILHPTQKLRQRAKFA